MPSRTLKARVSAESHKQVCKCRVQVFSMSRNTHKHKRMSMETLTKGANMGYRVSSIPCWPRQSEAESQRHGDSTATPGRLGRVRLHRLRRRRRDEAFALPWCTRAPVSSGLAELGKLALSGVSASSHPVMDIGAKGMSKWQLR